jgi:hypothetical protein
VNLSHFLAPSPDSPRKSKLILKKILSTIIATVAISIATLDTAQDLPSPAEEVESVPSVRLGLSRQRGAFRKAVSMLKEAAPENERLADYYERVTRRVKGHDDEAEQNDGVGVAITVRNPGRSSVSVARSQVASQGLIGVAQAASLSQSAPRSYQETDSSSRDDEEANSPGPLTVGDVAFDTNAAIERWIDYYTESPIGRSTLKIGIQRSNSYLEMARAEFRSAGVPEDLVWLAFVESVWNPRAVSPAAAGGLWQFIPSTATEYGLRVDTGHDERSDPFKQTRVAAAYLRDLYTIFGDWSLAMAAYNSGEPRVMGAIVRNGNANFWELSAKQLLPKETCEYVPKILATIKLASRADDYGSAPEVESVYAGD